MSRWVQKNVHVLKYTMRTLPSIIKISSIIFLLMLSGGYVWAACNIDKWPPPLIVQYQKDVTERLSKITTFASSKNLCSGKNGTFSAENRFGDFLQSIGTRTAYSQDLLTDFRYTIMVTSEWNSKWPVVNQGKILENIEASQFIPAIKNVVWACALDEVDPNTGLSPRIALSNMLENHRSLVAYYKAVVVWEKRIPTEIEGEMKAIFAEILANYNQEVTATCKADSSADVGKIQEKLKTIMESIQWSAKKTGNTQDDWGKAINLLLGKWAKTKEYTDLQKRLLSAELARQWVTQKARDSMLKKLSCVQGKTDPGSNPEELGKANYECSEVTSTIATNVTNFMQWLIYKSKTNHEFIQRSLAYDTAKYRLGTDMWDFWKEIQKAKTNDETLNEKMITDLVNIHAQITGTNILLKQQIPLVYKYCMYAQPDISCPKP